MAEPKIIKRYANRKLYDTEKSCYVTLDEISNMVKQGIDVKVLDNQTKEDLTSVTLAQILFEQEKKNKSLLPIAMLENILRTGHEALSEFLEKRVAQPARDIKEEAGRQVEKIEQTIKAAGETTEERLHVFSQLIETLGKNLDEMQKNIDERIRTAVKVMIPKSGIKFELKKLKKKVEDLEKQVSDVENGD